MWRLYGHICAWFSPSWSPISHPHTAHWHCDAGPTWKQHWLDVSSHTQHWHQVKKAIISSIRHTTRKHKPMLFQCWNSIEHIETALDWSWMSTACLRRTDIVQGQTNNLLRGRHYNTHNVGSASGLIIVLRFQRLGELLPVFKSTRCNMANKWMSDNSPDDQ